MDDLTERLQRLEDLAAINQLLIDYGRHLDARNFDAFSELFAPDGELLLGPHARARGRDVIKTTMEKSLGTQPTNSFHMIGSPMITITGDTGTSDILWAAITPDDTGRPKMGMFGHHLDQLVRHDGKWLFQRRAGYADLPAPAPKT